MEVLCKSHYGNDHLQMGKNPITVAEDLGQSMITGWVGGVQNGQNLDYVTHGQSLMSILLIT